MSITRKIDTGNGRTALIVATTVARLDEMQAQLRRGPSVAQSPATPRPPPPTIAESDIVAREAACATCDDFLGGFKRGQYRCRAKTGCTCLVIASPVERCKRGKWLDSGQPAHL